MENTSFIALSRQDTLLRQMDVIANNIANMNTSGFKAEKMMFRQELVRSQGSSGPVGDRMNFVRDIATVRDMSEGPLKSTGNPLDVAVRGKQMLAVETPEGERYTRDGSLQLDINGNLVTHQGYKVLDSGGQPIQFAPEDTDISIGRDGTIGSAAGRVGKLKVVEFDKSADLQMVGGGIYFTDQPLKAAEKPDVVQGMVEGSNVEPIIEISRMIEVNRAYAGVKDLIDQENQRIKNMVQEYSKSA